MESIKIGIVLYPTFGGSGVVATELGKALAKKGYEVHFITYSKPFKLGGFYENIYYHEVRVGDYPLFDYAPYELVLSSKIVDIAKYYKLDILHVHYAIPHASAAYMAKQILLDQGIDLPYITTLHGTDITLVGKDASFEPVITFSINKSDAVTAVSASLKQDTLSHFKIKTEIDVIPNFIHTEEARVEISEGLLKQYAPNGEKIISHVSNFRRVKRVPDIIRAFAKIREKVDARLILVGDGPYRNDAEALAKELELCEHIEFVGKLKSAKEVLAMSDLFILPSEKESFGLAALEAIAAGVPVISTNTGGVPEVVTHGKDGFLSAVGDYQDMAKNATILLCDAEKLEAFKSAASRNAKRYELEQIVPLYINLYNRVLSK